MKRILPLLLLLCLPAFARQDVSLNGAWQVALTLDGQPIGTLNLTAKELRFYNVAFMARAGAHTLKAEFVNDDVPQPEDRNLWLERLEFSSVN